MGPSLDPVLANIIMTELEKIIVKNLVQSKLIKFYIRYVDDTLVLVKKEHLSTVLNKLNSFVNNIQFTVDHFPDGIVHFLDLKVNGNQTDVYYKEAHTGQNTHFTS